MTTGLDIPAELPSFFCEPCVLAKQVRHVSHQPNERETQALAMVHTDLISPITPAEYDGSRYYLLLTDDATRITEGELFKSKSQVEQTIPRYTNKMERQLKLKLRAFRYDKGEEYINKQLQKWAGNKGIQWEFIILYNPHQNRVAERANRTILEKMRTMLLTANLKKSLWPLAYVWAIQLKNQAPSLALPEVMPIHALYGRIPDLYYLRVFGSTAYMHIPQEKQIKSTKLEPRSQRCQMVGYDGSGIYRVWDETKVLRTKDVVFDETQAWIGGPTNSISGQLTEQQNLRPVLPIEALQAPEVVPLEVELQGVNEALENDGGDIIDHSHISLTPLETESSDPNNLNMESVP